jgi:hypothetical protein
MEQSVILNGMNGAAVRESAEDEKEEAEERIQRRGIDGYSNFRQQLSSLLTYLCMQKRH